MQITFQSSSSRPLGSGFTQIPTYTRHLQPGPLNPPACRFGKKGDTLATLAAGALLITPLLGLWGILKLINPTPPSQPIGYVQPAIGFGATVTSDNQVNWNGIPRGSFDEAGNAYSPFMQLVGYTDKDGRMFKIETHNGVQSNVPVGFIDESGTVHGQGWNNGTQINLPNLTQQQKGAVAILTLP